MKRIFALSLAMLLAYNLCLGQETTITSSTSNISIQVKRCFAMENDVCIDLILMGNGRWQNVFLGEECELYDDEGNKYKGGFMGGSDYRYGINFEYDKKNSSRCIIDIPRDVPRKVRLRITDVDEYASSFIVINLLGEGNSTNANPFKITIKNLPISR